MYRVASTLGTSSQGGLVSRLDRPRVRSIPRLRFHRTRTMVPSDGAPRISPFPSVVRIDAAFVHHRQLPRPPSSRVLGSHPCIYVAFSTVSRGQDDVDLCETGRESWRSIANDVYHVQVPPRTRLVPRTLTSRWSGCRRSKAPPRSCSSFPRMPRHASAASDPSERPVVARSRAKHGRVSSMPSPNHVVVRFARRPVAFFFFFFSGAGGASLVSLHLPPPPRPLLPRFSSAFGAHHRVARATMAPIGLIRLLGGGFFRGYLPLSSFFSLLFLHFFFFRVLGARAGGEDLDGDIGSFDGRSRCEGEGSGGPRGRLPAPPRSPGREETPPPFPREPVRFRNVNPSVPR